MKKYVFLLFLLTGSTFLHAQQLTENQQQKIARKAEELYRIYNLHGDFIIGVVNENGMVYSYTLNRDILAGNPSELTVNSPFYVASHTKAFTGTMMQALEEHRQMDLNKTMADYLPGLTFDDEKVDPAAIRMKDLLNHTSGLMGLLLTWKSSFLGYEDSGDLLASAAMHYRVDPSRKFRYSNTGPVIASLAVEKVTGSDWKEQMKKYVFAPLEMNRTSCKISDFEEGEVLPSVYLNGEQETIRTGLYKSDQTLSAAGGVISTLDDLTKWLQANIRQDRRLLAQPASWKALHEPTVAQDREFYTYKRYGYSLGWDLATYRQDTLLTRFGGWGSISFHASFIPSRKTGVIAYSSDERAYLMPHLLANYAYVLMEEEQQAEAVFEKEMERFDRFFKEYSENTHPAKEKLAPVSEQNDRIAGTYTNEKGWPEIHIRKQNGGYLMSWGTLSGKVYKEQNEAYVSALGVIMRSFEIKGDSLFTGSLVYRKVE